MRPVMSARLSSLTSTAAFRACTLFVALATFPACASQRALGPLQIHLGLTPAQTAAAVGEYDFCRSAGEAAGARRNRETFVQCGRPGVAHSDAWVVAQYRDGRTVRLQRFERWPDDTRAAERWNQLIERRAVDGAASQYARDLIFDRQRIPDGTHSWVAFERGDELIGLYLLKATDPNEPRILEEILPMTP
jgi:hypothetical protein